MWKRICDWAAAVFTMTRQLEDHGETIRSLEKRVRDLEETLRLLAHEQRHNQEMQTLEREKLVMQLETELAKRELPQPGKKRRK
jgi:hypothetical protein